MTLEHLEVAGVMRDVVPGSGEIGLLAAGGRGPLGYHKDPDKTAATFRGLGRTLTGGPV
jgi:hypothetical protein